MKWIDKKCNKMKWSEINEMVRNWIKCKKMCINKTKSNWIRWRNGIK